ncbi:MAG TPA: sodium:proton antiporter [bacterium]|nr:sodium:proton antiporter [bacterium]
MNLFDATAILVALAAVFSYVNYRLLRLPTTTGILSLALLSSLLMLGSDWLFPQWDLRDMVENFLSGIDFYQVLLKGMLCFLLFAGALHVKFEDMRSNQWTILVLATVGVILSTLLVGGLSFALFGLLGLSIPFPICLVFGALLSPTDPIAVMGLLKELKAPKELDAMIAGESLFNDGVGVVVFLTLLGVAGVSEAPHLPLNSLGVALLFLREVAGGVLLGFLLGYLAFRALKSIDYAPLELLITLSLAMTTYALAFRLDVSGPIAVVVAGLLIGNQGKRFAMSERTIGHVDAFWGMMDDILNAILFLLIGLMGFDPRLDRRAFWAALAIIPVALSSRFLSVLVPITFLHWRRKQPGIVPILTWGGLRGGLSIAMALSLPSIPEKGILLTATYAVVLFSVLVQGMTMRKLLSRYGVG